MRQNLTSPWNDLPFLGNLFLQTSHRKISRSSRTLIFIFNLLHLPLIQMLYQYFFLLLANEYSTFLLPVWTIRTPLSNCGSFNFWRNCLVVLLRNFVIEVIQNYFIRNFILFGEEGIGIIVFCHKQFKSRCYLFKKNIQFFVYKKCVWTHIEKMMINLY